MKLRLGTNDIFDAPEGKYRATLERVAEPKKRINRPCAEQVRLSFRIKTPAGKEHLVARTFCADLGYGTELYTFLESWFDSDFAPLLDENGEIDLDLLLAREADILVTHWKGEDTTGKPFVKIAGIFPPGTLTND